MSKRGQPAEPDELVRAAYELTESIPVGTYTMVLRPGEELGRFAFMSKRFLRICGLDRATLDGDATRVFEILHPDDLDHWLELNRRAFTDRARFVGETRIIVDGQVHWVHAESIPRQLPGGETVWEGVLTDITDRKIAERAIREAQEQAEAANRQLADAVRQLERLASTDFLTGAFNRREFERLAELEIERAQRYGNPLSQIVLDIDHFKVINDRFGHSAGDHVLVEVTRLLQKQLRQVDMLARWGGEEFVVLLPQCDVQQACAAAEKLRASLENLSLEPVGQIHGSFGVAEYRPGEPLDDWLRRADAALYKAKQGGRNRVCPDPSAAIDPDS